MDQSQAHEGQPTLPTGNTPQVPIGTTELPTPDLSPLVPDPDEEYRTVRARTSLSLLVRTGWIERLAR